MQKILLYLLPNRLRVTADVAGFITEYRIMYQRTLKLYKGIDNTITFDVRDADQKKVDLRSYIPRVQVFDSEHKLIFSKTGTVNPVTPALFTVTFTSNELFVLNNQMLNLNAYLSADDSTVHDHLIYSDAQFGLGVTLTVEDGVVEKYRPPQEITDFQLNYGSKTYFSELIPFGPEINDDVSSDSARITQITYYPGNFRGLVEVEATTMKSTSYDNSWEVISSSNINSSMSFNVDLAGNYTFIRFKFPKSAGIIEKILVRN